VLTWPSHLVTLLQDPDVVLHNVLVQLSSVGWVQLISVFSQFPVGRQASVVQGFWSSQFKGKHANVVG